MLFSGLFERAEVAEYLGDRALLQAMLDVEVALSRALVELGVAPAEAAEELERVADADGFDLAALGRGAGEQGTPIPALLEELRTRLPDGPAAEHLHRGATSQDIVDTAIMLLVKRASEPLLRDLRAAGDACAGIAEQHRASVMPGRTLLQQATPITFGLKAAGWLAALDAAIGELRRMRRDLALQFGGAVGTLAASGERGIEIGAVLGRELGLALPAMPWHTDRVLPARIASSLAIACGAMGKIARDVVLLSQTEIREAREAGDAAHGGSSAMPHKQNPVGAVAIVACATRAPGLAATILTAMPQEHERGAGGWQAEWEPLLELLRLAASAAAELAELLADLKADAQRMRANIHELVMSESVALALTDALGAAAARSIVRDAGTRSQTENRPFRDVLLEVPDVRGHLSPEQLERALDPAVYLGATDALIDRVLDSWRGKEAK
jgi:3-carboxy-cis,cis-muconate cycloisomerase